jgi:hypothetical protein
MYVKPQFESEENKVMLYRDLAAFQALSIIKYEIKVEIIV